MLLKDLHRKLTQILEENPKNGDIPVSIFIPSRTPTGKQRPAKRHLVRTVYTFPFQFKGKPIFEIAAEEESLEG